MLQKSARTLECDYRNVREIMPPENETPAARVIRLFGGVRPLARALGRNPCSIVRWRRPRIDGGTGGAVPTSVEGRLLVLGEKAGITLTADDLIMRTELSNACASEAAGA